LNGNHRCGRGVYFVQTVIRERGDFRDQRRTPGDLTSSLRHLARR
jgi:hypothetical protein